MTQAGVQEPMRRGLLKRGLVGIGALAVLLVGRTEANDLTIDHQSISRVHAFFHCDGRTARWKISDAGSRSSCDHSMLKPTLVASMQGRGILSSSLI